MKNIRCILLDDEKEANDRLESLLLKIDGVEILSKFTKPALAIEDILSKKPDLVFVDVEMSGKTGFEVVEEVRLNHCYPTFIFVTAYNQYAIDAIKNAAFDYLLKPINFNELKNTIERFRSESVNHKTIDLNTCSVCSSLSEREKEVLLLVLKGENSAQIAKNLFITKATVDFHRKNILLKSGSHNFTELGRKINRVEFVG
ncbi:MAG: DNA-binding response regulator [Bacteroidetes bacterium]|nr:DNA-binding response regulator [Bacteroidota bacterium]